MKAIVMTKFGPPEVLQLQEVAKPEPKANEVLIRIHASSVNFGDLMARDFKAVTPRNFNMPLVLLAVSKLIIGVNRPRLNIPGSEFSGLIEKIGDAVTRFKPGDPVFGFSSDSFGAYAEYLCLPETGVLVEKPVNLTHAEAAVLPYGSIIALNLLKKVNIQPGHKVLINGASGAIGSAAVQIAKQLGAEVTGVCGSPRLDFVRSLGADKVVDYTKTGFAQNLETYDLIVDILGKALFTKFKKFLAPKGVVLYASFKLKHLLQMMWTSMGNGQKVKCAIAPGGAEDLNAVKKMIEADQIKAIIDRSFSLDQAAEAHRYVESGHKKGNVAINILTGI